jgi:dethiobiotin synthetase
VSRWGVVIGSWPSTPGLAERCNVADLQTLPGARLVGALPEGAAAAFPADFLQLAWAGLAPVLGGSFDAADFTARTAPEPKASE